MPIFHCGNSPIRQRPFRERSAEKFAAQTGLSSEEAETILLEQLLRRINQADEANIPLDAEALAFLKREALLRGNLLTDDQGNLIRDEHGNPAPLFATGSLSQWGDACIFNPSCAAGSPPDPQFWSYAGGAMAGTGEGLLGLGEWLLTTSPWQKTADFWSGVAAIPDLPYALQGQMYQLRDAAAADDWYTVGKLDPVANAYAGELYGAGFGLALAGFGKGISLLGKVDSAPSSTSWLSPVNATDGDFGYLNQPVKINLLPDAAPSAPWSMMDDIDWGSGFGVGAGSGSGNAVDLAKAWQTQFPYLSQDPMRPIALSEGKVLVQVVLEADGFPAGIYFTTISAVRRATLPDGSIDANILNQGLQIDASKYQNFRASLQYFKVNEAVPVGEAAFGRAIANTHLNPSGYPPLPQIFLKEEYLGGLSPIDNVGNQSVIGYPMVNTSAPTYPFEWLPKKQ